MKKLRFWLAIGISSVGGLLVVTELVRHGAVALTGGYAPVDFASWLIGIVAIAALICVPILAPKKRGGHGALPRYLRQLRYRWAVAHMPIQDDWGRPIAS